MEAQSFFEEYTQSALGARLENNLITNLSLPLSMLTFNSLSFFTIPRYFLYNPSAAEKSHEKSKHCYRFAYLCLDLFPSQLVTGKGK